MEHKVTIPAENKYRLENEIAKLNKRAAKLGMAPVTIEFTNERTIEEVANTVEHGPILNVERLVDVTVTGTTPIIEGWEVIAVVEHGNPTIVSNFTGDKIDPKYREEAFCDHCHTKRVWKHTIIARNVETGEVISLGRGCAKDYFDKPITAYLNAAKFVLELISEIEDEDEKWFGGGYSEPGTKKETLLELAANVINTSGFVGSNNDRGLLPTKNIVMNILSPKEYAKYWEENTLTDADKKFVADFEKYVAESTDDSDFMLNVKALMENEWIPVKRSALIVGAMGGFFYKVKREATEKAEKKFVDAYAGKLKERKEFEVELLAKIPYDNFYGGGVIYKMIDTDGHCLTCFHTGYALEKGTDEDGLTTYFEAGDKFKIAATIKKHDKYKGTFQTIVNRMKVK